MQVVKGRVSVIVPTRNRAALLALTLQSAQTQSLDDLEIIVVDDASEDATPAVVQRIRSIDRRVSYIALPERAGAPRCRNQGLELSTGEFVQFLDSDDLIHRDKLGIQVRALEENPQAGLAVCQVGLFTQRPGDTDLLWNRLCTGDPLDRFLRHDLPWVTVGPLWRRSNLERVGPWDETLEVSQDYEFSMRALVLGAPPVLHRHVLGFYRVHTGETIGSATLHLRERTHLRVFRKVRALLEAAGREGSWRRDLRESLVWVTARAWERGSSQTAWEALTEARGLAEDPGQEATLAELADSVSRLGDDADAKVFDGVDVGMEEREGWWGKWRLSDEPGDPPPIIRRYRRSSVGATESP
jgi:glycosyltransferase involved in cell wall biosynthesis